MFAVADYVHETSVTAGVGTLTLLGAATGKQPVSVIGANNYCTYSLHDGTNWEVGIGRYLAGPARLQRDTILASSNAGSAVNWSGSTTIQVRVGLPAAGIKATRRKTKSVAGSANVALTQDEMRCDVLELTGALTGNIEVQVDDTPWSWPVVYNNTTGAFTITMKVAGQTGVRLTQGAKISLYCDGTDVRRAQELNDLDLGPGARMINGVITPSRAGNAETVAIKTKAGNDPSVNDPVLVIMRSATANSGDYTVLRLTAATSIVISSGSTLGFASGVGGRFWLVGFNDAGTFRLGVINCVSHQASAGSGREVTAIYPLGALPIASSTAEGGAGAADSAGVFYTGTAVSAKPYAILGYLDYTLAAAGTWDTAATNVEPFGPGIALPGQEIQRVLSRTGAVATGTTTLPYDDTIPQSSEGVQFMSQAFTPKAKANVLSINHLGWYSQSSGADSMVAALFQDSIANALAAMENTVGAANSRVTSSLDVDVLADTVSSTTFKIRAGSNGAGTVTLNGSASARRMGGVAATVLRIREVMG